MSDLANYQASLFAHILGQDGKDLNHQIATRSGTQTEAQQRLNVYRNNYMHSLRESLSDSFPVIKRLLGDDLFNGLATHYVQMTPPETASLMNYGYDFLAFITNHDACKNLMFLKDVGHIEWLYIQCFHGPDAEVVTLYDLLDVDEDELPEIVFHSHPNLHLFHSVQPALDIWQANLEDEVPELNLNTLPETFLMMYREEQQVVPMQLTPLAYYFLAALTEGKTIAAAWIEAQKMANQTADDDEVSDLLAFLIQKPVFSALKTTTKETP